ncbi:hypothetical protein CDD83_8293 [Cordyceps sp. RAO-2017]|nr:hypothetical protein CDD83_8293 [Cordyceps sp. RAO-2017]
MTVAARLGQCAAVCVLGTTNWRSSPGSRWPFGGHTASSFVIAGYQGDEAAATGAQKGSTHVAKDAGHWTLFLRCKPSLASRQPPTSPQPDRNEALTVHGRWNRPP